MVLWKKLWYYGKNYGTILRTSINEENKKHGTLPNTKKLWFIMDKTKEIYQNNKFWTDFRTLIYYGKTMVLWKNLWNIGKNYGTIPKTIEKTMVLCQKLWYYGKL